MRVSRFFLTLVLLVVLASNAMSSFLVGVNLPWVGGRYGWNYGGNPWDPGKHDGISTHPDELRGLLRSAKEYKFKATRDLIFADCRTGLVEINGKVQLDKYVLPDIEMRLKIAEEEEILVTPVLFDWMIADGKKVGNGLGEHPEYIVNSKRREQVYEALVPVFKLFEKYHKSIYAWESFNEPEHTYLYSGSWNERTQLCVFLYDLNQLGITHAPSVRSTIGSATSQSLQSQWVGFFPNNFHQFHYYFYGNASFPPNARSISEFDVFIGEFECRYPGYQLTWAKNNNYSGAFFWALDSQDGLKLKEADLDAVKNWQEANE